MLPVCSHIKKALFHVDSLSPWQLSLQKAGVHEDKSPRPEFYETWTVFLFLCSRKKLDPTWEPGREMLKAHLPIPAEQWTTAGPTDDDKLSESLTASAQYLGLNKRWGRVSI